jgi:hypothetical protein
MVISKKLDAGWSHPVEVEVACEYGSWKSKRRWREKRWFRNYHCRNPGGMCYRHNLARPDGGPRARWAQEIIIIGL